MVLIVLIVVILIMFALVRKGGEAKYQEKPEKLSADDRTVAVAERQRKQQETDELITVILPTIRNDK